MRFVSVAFILFSLVALADDPCKDEVFPKGDWVKPYTSVALGASEAEAKKRLKKKVSELVTTLRSVCIEPGGEAYWYREQAIQCLPVAQQFFCEETVETECVAKDL